MKLKFITAVVAFSITFGFSTVLAGLFSPNNQTAQKISLLLQQDIANGQAMDGTYQSVFSIEFAEAVGEYTDNSQAIDDTNLPADFRFAWRNHMQAWRAHADFLNRGGCLRKSMSAEEISQIIIEQKYEINTTWMTVLRIARRHEAVIPYNAY